MISAISDESVVGGRNSVGDGGRALRAVVFAWRTENLVPGPMIFRND